ncbi:hypothetical protein [Pseudomonas laurylsulfatiphila]|uniref:hypothetical protein n=1 Tax=Pseudomonas laurylsulfatiphila TaxID=2011015 RepID=UPI0011B0C2A4|nr:hypothetical protein [Pseudomonas laurylsulfatiphila]
MSQSGTTQAGTWIFAWSRGVGEFDGEQRDTQSEKPPNVRCEGNVQEVCWVQDQKIAACGSSYRNVFLQVLLLGDHCRHFRFAEMVAAFFLTMASRKMIVFESVSACQWFSVIEFRFLRRPQVLLVNFTVRRIPFSPSTGSGLF